MSVDRVLAAIDAGLQRSTEGALSIYSPDECWRCGRPAGEGPSEVCEPCRAFLLGDVEADPAARDPYQDIVMVDWFAERVRPIAEGLVDVMERWRRLAGLTGPIMGRRADLIIIDDLNS